MTIWNEKNKGKKEGKINFVTKITFIPVKIDKITGKEILRPLKGISFRETIIYK